MTISERYRQLTEDARQVMNRPCPAIEEADKVQRKRSEAVELLDELSERVGEIPQFKLEAELTPVLLKAHNRLDQARLMLLEAEQAEEAQQVWQLEQAIYRLLNSL